MRRICAVLLMLMLLLLCGCAEQPETPSYITVSLALPEGCGVLENGLRITSGQDAVFELVVEEGYEFSRVDYDGEYTTEYKHGVLYLRLLSVRYSTMAPVTLTSRFCSITYEPNGGEGAAETVTYDRSNHLRPNTSIGIDLFDRKGFTLIGWNTAPDGSGISVGLGSRVSVPDGKLTLYAQWSPWTPASQFDWENTDEGVRIVGYHGTEETVTVPGRLNDEKVTVISSGAFLGNTASHISLPPTVKQLEAGAFTRSQLEELTFFDTLETFGDDTFVECDRLTTVHINAAEAPWGYDYRRESCLADKVDILIEARGRQKMVFYGGCSMWYNLDGTMAAAVFGEEYQIINLGLNGVMNSSAQMQILTTFLEPGDIFFHTPEISSQPQLMQRTQMINHDRKLWCGMEYNYDLVGLLDIRTLPEFFDILYYWLSTKEQTSGYTDVYRDYLGNSYVDEFGCASFFRDKPAEKLDDTVYLDPEFLDPTGLARLEEHYRAIQDRGVKIYVGHACVNMEALPEDQRDRVELMDGLFRERFSAMEGITVVGQLSDYLYRNSDFYDTNYHLLTEAAQRNTWFWLRDLTEQMAADGLWEITE